jgi:hypothetical protein
MLTVCLGVGYAQSNQDADSNISCVERLQMPVFPSLAHQARVEGSVSAVAVLASDGSIESTGMEVRSAIPTAKLLLTPAVERAIRASVFRKSCSGRSVRLVFNFGFDSDPGKSVSFGYPNQFWILVPPPPIFAP